jgi:hypothetical protein
MQHPARGTDPRRSARQMERLWLTLFVAFLAGMGLWLGRQFGAF